MPHAASVQGKEVASSIWETLMYKLQGLRAAEGFLEPALPPLSSAKIGVFTQMQKMRNDDIKKDWSA